MCTLAFLLAWIYSRMLFDSEKHDLLIFHRQVLGYLQVHQGIKRTNTKIGQGNRILTVELIRIACQSGITIRRKMGVRSRIIVQICF
ncbi:hypothetical protein MTR67_022161 [Solanum verrucosum]|uniref:Uncharacterized protein n=1 Tax=Solanum verrucosum TaxID=315347 RepID=A0AAF0TQI3_SOLVR|nr:hypothetical protein MTR67_022161 [Solanum verrucosum]